MAKLEQSVAAMIAAIISVYFSPFCLPMKTTITQDGKLKPPLQQTGSPAAPASRVEPETTHFLKTWEIKQ